MDLSDQADLDYKSRKAQEDKLLRLKEAEQQRKLSDKERKLAQRYHMVSPRAGTDSSDSIDSVSRHSNGAGKVLRKGEAGTSHREASEADEGCS